MNLGLKTSSRSGCPCQTFVQKLNRQILYCSRTHSQLSQFVGELRRVKLPPGLTLSGSTEKQKPDDEQLEEVLKHLTLGSRKNLCINSKVASLGSATAINERCLELQDQGK